MKPLPDFAAVLTTLAAALLLFSLSACSDAPETDDDTTAATTAAPAVEPATTTAYDPAAALTLPHGEALQAGSIYDIESTWQNANSETVQLSDLNGKVRVVAMGYTSCKYACPRLIFDMRSLREKIIASSPDKENTAVGFVFVSIDTENDTPEKLKAYAELNEFADSDDWLMLTGEEDSVLELAVVLGMKYRKADETDFAHSNIITVLDAEGHIVHQQFGLGTDDEKTIAAIQATAAPSAE